VHLFQTAPYGEVGLDGNSVAIIGDDGVLVFDTNGTPAAAEAVLAEIRRLTPLVDRAVTPGDTFLYLPRERIVIAGDLLVNPISFALSSYPTAGFARSGTSTAWTRR